jgi:hypothetical protein
VVRERLEKCDQDHAIAESTELVVRGLGDLEHELRRPGVADGRTGVGVHAVGKARRLAGTALDDDFVSALGEPTDRLRDEGDAPLAGRGLPHDTDPHGTRKA